MAVEDNSQISKDENRTAWPFFAALAVVGVILAAVLAVALRSPDTANSDGVVQAVRSFVAAHNGVDDALRRAAVCPAFDNTRSPLAGQDNERVALVTADNPTITGENATVSVTTRLDKSNSAERNATWNVVKTAGGWRVCD